MLLIYMTQEERMWVLNDPHNEPISCLRRIQGYREEETLELKIRDP